jgi:DNA replication protein DnaC
MTIFDERLAAWLASFKTRHGLAGVPLAADPDLAEERTRQACAYAAKHVPARYATALPARPEPQQWAADVVRGAASASEGRRQVASVHGGPSLLLLGQTGAGKTHEAYGALRVIAACGLHCRWVAVSAADLYARMRPRHGVDAETEFAAAADAPLLVVDDLGAAKTSEWVEEINYRLVNRRYESMLPTVFTSNVPPQDEDDGEGGRVPGLGSVLGDRVTSRLIEMTTLVVFEGGDRRRGAA